MSYELVVVTNWGEKLVIADRVDANLGVMQMGGVVKLAKEGNYDRLTREYLIREG